MIASFIDLCKELKIKNLAEYHGLYVHCDTLLLAGVFENFGDKCIIIYGLDPANCLSAPGLAWQACLKMTGVKLELLTDPDMLLIVEDGIRGGMCQAIYRYAKANNKYMNNYDKRIIDANNLYGWAMSQELPVNDLKWVKKFSKFNERFMKGYNRDRGYFLEVDVEDPNILFNLHKDLPYLLEIKKLEKVKKLACCIENKK